MAENTSHARPKFITFTGVDAHTDPAEMRAMSRLYPIEWGILFSPSRRGKETRYPELAEIQRVCRSFQGGRYAAHLCGGDAREVLERGKSSHDDLLFECFTRAQVNTAQPIDPARLQEWGDALSISVIVQCRGAEFPTDKRVEWLFDKSGGRGIAPVTWPPIPHRRRVGFAGGLSPSNVAAAVASIAGTAPDAAYWIDMESGVRDERDRFSLNKCRAVCEAVYG